MAHRNRSAPVGQISLFAGEPPAPSVTSALPGKPSELQSGAPIPPPPSIRSAPARPRRARVSQRRSFVVGRLNRKTREMRLLSQPLAEKLGPFPGPWSLEAVVGGGSRKLRLV